MEVQREEETATAMLVTNPWMLFFNFVRTDERRFLFPRALRPRILVWNARSYVFPVNLCLAVWMDGTES